MKRNLMWTGLAVVLAATVIRVAGCAGQVSPSDQPIAAGDVCMEGDRCFPGTICVAGRCVANPCTDEDGDGAGIGPGCAVLDCDDTDPTVPDSTEACNDRDDDCDRAIDEGCPCLQDGAPVPDGSTRPCGSGDCAGVQTCVAGTWAACEGGREPVAESCFNGVDDDCNGAEDEGCCPDTEFACLDTARCSSNGMCV
jgi:hypothetical protein